MNVLTLILNRLNLVAAFRQLASDQQRRVTLMSLATAQMLVQLTFIPVTLTIPSVAAYFGVNIVDAAWTVIARLLVLGSTVFLSSRLGARYGHIRLFCVGIVIMTLSSMMAATSQNLTQLIIWSGTGGLGGGLVIANSNAILSLVFRPDEMGRAFAVPVTASRFGTLIGIGLFGLFLQFISWRLVFVTSFATGLIALKYAYPMLKYQYQQSIEEKLRISIDYLGGILMITTLVVFILSGSHLHDGAESFTSNDGLGYHVPMHLLAVALFALFVVLQLRSKNPFLEFRNFKTKYFSMALFTNTTVHLSMLTIFTMVPILIEGGLGKAQVVVSMVLFVHQSFGLFVTPIAGMLYDRYHSRLMAPISMFMIAMGISLMGFFSAIVPVWALPLLLLPASIGTSMFISPWNAVVMNSLQEDRSFASGMLETTRQMGHTVGVTIGATVIGLSLPLTINLLPAVEAQAYYRQGFQMAALIVVWIIIAGGITSIFQKMPGNEREGIPANAAPQTGGDG